MCRVVYTACIQCGRIHLLCIKYRVVYTACIQCGRIHILPVLRIGWYTLHVFSVGGYILSVSSVGLYNIICLHSVCDAIHSPCIQYVVLWEKMYTTIFACDSPLSHYWNCCQVSWEYYTTDKTNFFLYYPPPPRVSDHLAFNVLQKHATLG